MFFKLKVIFRHYALGVGEDRIGPRIDGVPVCKCNRSAWTRPPLSLNFWEVEGFYELGEGWFWKFCGFWAGPRESR